MNLLPCPFCGREADVIDYDDECWVAHQCVNGTSAETNSYETVNEAIAAWNSRAGRTCKEYGSIRVWQSCNVWSHELSCGHEVDTLESEPPNYCPNCGAKVVSE